MTVPLSSVDGPLPARTPITQFDPLGELPRGTVILEASAGTGKTWTIAALAARYVADGLGLDQLMMITFTRQATQELRNRIRDRLLRSARHLRDVLTTGGRTCDDPIDALLASGPRAQVELRLQRLTRALTDFDAATISTTHEFCQRMLAGLGVLVDHSADDTLVEDLSDRAREVAADFYLRAYADGIKKNLSKK